MILILIQSLCEFSYRDARCDCAVSAAPREAERACLATSEMLVLVCDLKHVARFFLLGAVLLDKLAPAKVLRANGPYHSKGAFGVWEEQWDSSDKKGK